MAKKYCINCGNLVPETAKFCPSCGAPQHGEDAGKFRANDPAIDLGKVALDFRSATAIALNFFADIMVK